MDPQEITAIVLCGGAGSRLGAADKTLVSLGGRPLVNYTLEGLTPQVGHIVLSCGRGAESYAGLGQMVVVDATLGQGPLGGFVSALPVVETEWILVHPGDTPFPAADLVARLGPTAAAEGVAVPRVGRQRQHLVMLVSSAMAQRLAAFYRDGGRAVRRWLDELGVEGVDLGDIAGSFFNVNTPADLAAGERRLMARR